MRRSGISGKLVLGAAAGLALAATAAGNVCTWTGLGGDGKWSTAANWRDAEGVGNVPVSGQEDTLVFASGATALTVENDLEGFVAGAILTTNANATTSIGVTIAGKPFTLSGATAGRVRFNGYCNTTFETPLTLGVGMQLMFRASGTFAFKGDLTLTTSGTVRLGGGTTAIIPSVYFYGNVTGPNAEIDAVNEENNGYEYYWYYGRVVLRQYDAGMEYRNNPSYFCAPSNDVQLLRVVGYGTAYAETDNAFMPGNCLMQVSTAYPKNIGGRFYADRDVTFAKVSVDATKGSKRTSINGTKTLTIAAGEDLALPYWSVNDSASLRWSPTNDCSLTLSTATNATTGAVLVDRGTLKIGDAVTFRSLTKLLLFDQAALEIAAGSANCFGTSPAVVLYRSATSTVKLDADVTVKSLYVDGVLQTRTSYSAAAGDTWISGTGTLTVTTPAGTAVTYWDAAADGDYSDAANWTQGIPSTSVKGYLTKWNATARISQATSIAGAVTIAATYGTTTLETAADTSVFGTMAIGDGTGPGQAVLKVTSGTATFAKSPTLKRDGRIEATGGTLDISNAFSSAGGTVVLSGTSRMVNGRTDGIFLYRFRSGTLSLRDHATLAAMNHSGSRNYFAPSGEGESMLLEARDDAFFNLANNDGIYLGINAPANSTSRMVLSGRARASGGNGFNVLSGAAAGATAELDLQDNAYFLQSMYGMRAGSSAGTTYTMRMTGGCFDCNATSSDVFQHAGFVLGYMTANARSSSKAAATLYLENGVITNRSYAMTTLGAGNAVGRIVQTGGRYIARPTSWSRKAATFNTPPIVLGYLGGEGYWDLSGGEVRNTTMLFVGGVTTNALGHSYKASWMTSFSFPVKRSAEKGVLTVTGGLFENLGDAYVSYDGPGTIAIGAGGELRARNLYLMHATDQEDPTVTHVAKLAYTLGDATSGAINLTGALDVETDAELTVDARAYTARKSVRLLTAAGGVTRTFADGKVTFLSDSPLYTLLRDGRGLKLACASGTVLYVR